MRGLNLVTGPHEQDHDGEEADGRDDVSNISHGWLDWMRLPCTARLLANGVPPAGAELHIVRNERHTTYRKTASGRRIVQFAGREDLGALQNATRNRRDPLGRR